MDVGDAYIECDAEESPNCTNSVPIANRTWDDHLTTFVNGTNMFLLCKKGQLPTYKLNVSFEGAGFFDNFNFWTTNNKSEIHGFVEWLNRSTAEQLGLVKFINGQVKKEGPV